MAAIHFAAAAALLLIASCSCCCASEAPAAAGAAAAQAAGSGGGHARHPEEALIKWAKDRGAEINVAIETRGGVRGTYASADVAAGGVIAKVPMAAAIWFPYDYTNFRELAVRLLRESRRPDSPHAPHIRALTMLRPAAEGVGAARAPLALHSETFPPEYLHVLGSYLQARHIATTQWDTEMFWAGHGLKLVQEGFTLAHLKAAMLTVSTRYMTVAHRGREFPVIVPVVDMANHHTTCANWYEFRPCNASLLPWPRVNWDLDALAAEANSVEQEELCAYWMAAAEIRAGEEACLSYGYLTPDLALLQYGFILPDDPPQLSRMDEPGFAHDMKAGRDTHSEAPRPFAGSASEVEREVARVESIAAALERSQGAAAATPHASTDPDGSALASLLQLRAQRVASLRAEAARLRRQLEATADAAAAAAAGGGEHAAAQEAVAIGGQGLATKSEL